MALFGQQPRRVHVAVLAFLAVFICYIDRVNISVAIIPMAEDLGWGMQQQGTVLSAFFAGYILRHGHVGAAVQKEPFSLPRYGF